MDVFDELIESSDNKKELMLFLNNHIQALYDFILIQSFSDLSTSKNKIETYILSTLTIIKTLDFSIKDTQIFIILLLDVSERFCFFMPFKKLYELLKKKNCEISSRLEASSHYIIGIDKITDYNTKIEPILNKLLDAYNEEDTTDRIIGTVINFYAQVVHNFGSQNPQGVLTFKTELYSFNKEFYFLNNELIETISQLDVSKNITTFLKIQELLDIFLKRPNKDKKFIKDYFLLESNTPYSLLVEKTNPDFNSIKNISIDQYKKIENDSIFHSLQRGVNILTEESQLYAYLHSYGNMHYKKMITSFDFFPKEVLFNNDIDVIDWGCGQGLATLSLLDYYNKIKQSSIPKLIILIEPSELAIKRASLHIKKLANNIDIKTINKDLDSLIRSDFDNKIASVKLHLFSNILDIDLFSMSQLTKLIESTFQGNNYFICVSPYINELKTNRLDSFVNYFSNYNSFKLIESINNNKNEWEGTNWTRVLRILSVNI